MFGLDVKAVGVVEKTVPGLGDHRQRPPVAGGVGVSLGHSPRDHRVAGDADAVGVGDHHWTLEEPRLVDPGRAGHLAVAVEREPAREHRVGQGALAAREDGGDPGAHRVALDQSGVADGDSCDIGDRIERSRHAFERHPEIAGADRGAGLKGAASGWRAASWRACEQEQDSAGGRGAVADGHEMGFGSRSWLGSASLAHSPVFTARA